MPSPTPRYRQLPVKLTEKERMARAMSAAELQSDYNEIEERKKETTRSLGQQLKDLRKDIEKLQRAVRTGSEHQDVQIETRRNEDRRTIETVRLDTGEIIDSRPMTVEERQGKLFGIDGGKAEKKPKKGEDGAKASKGKGAAAGDGKADEGAKKPARKRRKAASSSKGSKDSTTTDDTTPPSA